MKAIPFHATLMVVLLALLPGSSPARGQQAGDVELARIADELTALNRTLNEVSALLQATLEHSEVDLLIKRLELAQKAIEPRERRLENARAELASVTDQEAHFQAEWERFEEEVRSGSQPAASTSSEDLQQRRKEGERMMKLIKDRVRAAEQRIIDLENELAADRRAIFEWQEEIDKRLGLR